MAATKRHARVDVYMPVWCQVCQLLCQFCQLGDLMELWAGKNRQKNRRWRQKEGYILAGTDQKEEIFWALRARRTTRREGRKRQFRTILSIPISFFALILQVLNVFIV